MQDLGFTPYDADWQPLPSDAQERRLWTPEQVEVYDAYTWRNRVRRTPADFARETFPAGQWIDFPHITYISDLIAAFMRDELLGPNGLPAKRLFLTMPPRHGKSYLLSQTVPAWYLSMYPDRHVILTTYEAEFAASWGGKVRDTLAAHGPKFGISLDPSVQAKGRWGLAKPYLGGMITAGMGGPITGMGAGLLIGDDWVKNSDEADSEPWRRKAWNWYNTTFKTRFQKDLSDPTAIQPKMLLLMTRWHDDDPMGRLMRRQEALGDLVIVHLPALCTDPENDPLGRALGDALCPPIMSALELRGLRAEDPPSFEALYQGNPTPDEGGLFSKSHFRQWRYATAYAGDAADGAPLTGTYILLTPEGAQVPHRAADCKHFITADLAISEKKRADYTVFSCWAITPDRDLLLTARFRAKIAEADHLPALQTFYDDQSATLRAAGGGDILQVGIEKATYGLSLIANARRSSNMPIRELSPDTDKFSRAVPAGTLTKGGKFYLPENAAWAEEFVGECCQFPLGTHDDQVDTFSYAAHVMNTTFRGVSARFTSREAAGDNVSSRISEHVAKIAARNDRIQRKRRRNGGWGL